MDIKATNLKDLLKECNEASQKKEKEQTHGSPQVSFSTGNKRTINITIHMPQRTSKILLVRLTANENTLF